jgi:hypothetical protein
MASHKNKPTNRLRDTTQNRLLVLKLAGILHSTVGFYGRRKEFGSDVFREQSHVRMVVWKSIVRRCDRRHDGQSIQSYVRSMPCKLHLIWGCINTFVKMATSSQRGEGVVFFLQFYSSRRQILTCKA